MHTVNIEEAAEQLSRLVDEALKGEPFVIAREGKPLVKVEALPTPVASQRIGFMAGQISIPDDFNRMGEEEIAALFGADV